MTTSPTVRFPLPEWVRLVPIAAADAAERTLTELIADSQEDGQTGRAEYEAAASDVIEGAVDQGVWALGLATPPGAPAALLAVTGFTLPVAFDRHATTALLNLVEDQGAHGTRLVRLDYGQTALLLHRRDRSGAQAQAFVPDPDGGGCFVLTLAATQPDRGPELLDLLRAVVAVASVK